MCACVCVCVCVCALYTHICYFDGGIDGCNKGVMVMVMVWYGTYGYYMCTWDSVLIGIPYMPYVPIRVLVYRVLYSIYILRLVVGALSDSAIRFLVQYFCC